MSKRKIIIILVSFVFSLGAFLFWLFKPSFLDKAKKNTQSNNTSPEPILISTLTLAQRPYLLLEPKSSVEPKSLGHWVTVNIIDPKEFERVEYEFEYTTATIIQGGMGRLDFRREPAPIKKEIAFGSASKGKYKYDEGVNKGHFIFHFFKEDKEAVLKTDFILETRMMNGGIFRTADGKGRLEVDKTDLAENDYLLIASTLGLPQMPQNQVLAGPYSFYADSPKKLKESKVIFNDIKEKEVLVLFWNGQKWEELETRIINEEAVAIPKALGVFVLVAQ